MHPSPAPLDLPGQADTPCPLSPCLPLTGIAFTVLILLTEEAVTIEASHFIPRLNIP